MLNKRFEWRIYVLTDNNFDMVFDCQKIFKSVMNAMANPGKIFNIKQQSEKLEIKDCVPAAMAMTFMDNRSRLYVEDSEELCTYIKENTLAVKSSVEDADFIFATDIEGAQEYNRKLIDCAKVGTLPEPHKSAMLIVGLKQFDGEKTLIFKGPGIENCREVKLPEAAVKWMDTREEKNYEFPCGIDIIFYTNQGDIMGIPRTLKVGGID